MDLTHPVLLLREGPRLGFACEPRPRKVAHLSSLLAYGKTERIEAWVGTEFRYNKSPRERDDNYELSSNHFQE
jgi:hypothetical protein